METIRLYLDNLFSPLPKTEAMLKLKNDLLANMEDKYGELKAAGRTENEAIGIVISEFGNIDEILAEMDIRQPLETENKREIREDEVREYLNARKTSAHLVAWGVALCILGVAQLIFFSQWIEGSASYPNINGDAAALIPLSGLFLLVAIAVGLFIFAGMKTKLFTFIEEGDFSLSPALTLRLQEEWKLLQPRKTAALIIGVALCILSPVILFAFTAAGEGLESYGVCFLLLTVAAGVFILIRFASSDEGHKRLLEMEEYAPKKRETNRITGIVAAIVWPLAVAIFLLLGFLYQLWHIAWVVFPITGVLFGGFAAAYEAAKNK